MWSLPDISRLNANAAKDAAKIKRAAKTGKLDGEKLKCEHYNAPNGCDGKVTGEPWYDIFSDDPKGIVSLCKHHREDYSDTPEGYFRCDECGRLMVENYTWERYETNGSCLNCARDAYLKNDLNWIVLKGPVPQVPFDTIRKTPHLIAVGQGTPKGLALIGNAEFDSTSGQQISGDDIRTMLAEAKGNGHHRAILILDAGYQFAVSIGVYVEDK